MTSVIAHPLPEGTLVRSAGRTYDWTVEDHVTAEEAEDGIAFYWGSSPNGVNDVLAPEALVTEVIRTAQEMRDRKPPTSEQIVRGLDLLGDHDVFDCDETEPDGTALLLYGKTPDGLRLSVRIEVTSVEVVDL